MRSLILMKAMPVTKGHAAMIEFARHLSGDLGTVDIIMDFAPDEPFVVRRLDALKKIANKYTGVRVQGIPFLPQTPADADDFWDQWKAILYRMPYIDTVIGSEPYCEQVADLIGAKYMPYDPNRDYVYTKATRVRHDPVGWFDQIAPEMQETLRTTVTIFGAESTGKTTLAKDLALYLDYAPWIFEYARPYLETRGTDITVESMTDIWKGQYALQMSARRERQDSPWIVQDTDLYTTIGYWEQPHWAETLGEVPSMLRSDAKKMKSDLYIITQANIPFEEDPLRYGGDHRESPDEYWIKVAEDNDLNYVVLDADRRPERLTEAMSAARLTAEKKLAPLRYERNGND